MIKDVEIKLLDRSMSIDDFIMLSQSFNKLELSKYLVPEKVLQLVIELETKNQLSNIEDPVIEYVNEGFFWLSCIIYDLYNPIVELHHYESFESKISEFYESFIENATMRTCTEKKQHKIFWNLKYIVDDLIRGFSESNYTGFSFIVLLGRLLFYNCESYILSYVISLMGMLSDDLIDEDKDILLRLDFLNNFESFKNEINEYNGSTTIHIAKYMLVCLPRALPFVRASSNNVLKYWYGYCAQFHPLLKNEFPSIFTMPNGQRYHYNINNNMHWYGYEFDQMPERLAMK